MTKRGRDVRKSHPPEAGMTLVEMVIAMGILTVFMGMASVTVEVIVNQSTSMAQSTQAIDQLQLGEENIVRDIHAATAWCAAQSFVAPETDLQFTASVNGAVPAPAFDIKITNNQLEIAENTTGACSWTTYSTLVYNLDPSTTGAHASAFTIQVNTPWTGGAHTPGVTYQFYTSVTVSLTVDTPKPGASRVHYTSLGDVAEIWNQEYACQTAWANDPPTVITGWINPC